MIVIDTPDTPPQSAPVIMLAENKASEAGSFEKMMENLINKNRAAEKLANKPEHIIGVCIPVQNVAPKEIKRTGIIDPWSDMSAYFEYFEGREITYYEGNSGPLDIITAEIVQEPKHGKLIKLERGKYPSYDYQPEPGYLGDDLAIIQGEFNGYKVKMYYVIKSLNHPANPYSGSECGKEDSFWKISTTPTIVDTASLTDGAYSLSLPATFAGIDYANPAITFTNLDGAAVGEVRVGGADATIILDTDAAGHGWYIDYTPYLNEDFLPTSNPNAWAAKAGSLVGRNKPVRAVAKTGISDASPKISGNATSRYALRLRSGEPWLALFRPTRL